jgi:hypothetical protein
MGTKADYTRCRCLPYPIDAERMQINAANLQAGGDHCENREMELSFPLGLTIACKYNERH